MSLFASTLPSHDGYVAAAYIVFFALVLIYVAIMAVRLGRVERKLRDMQRERVDERPSASTSPVGAQRAEAGEQERELV
jgi:hypothetical protein